MVKNINRFRTLQDVTSKNDTLTKYGAAKSNFSNESGSFQSIIFSERNSDFIISKYGT
ncbi:MAG TPA: hypothetical protein VE548_10960 [Nitrososphaeraceae archaeon]|jgi:hypothetical protein|nr:hypothetical protein [Nitrososphaeraceae archaeon]